MAHLKMYPNEKKKFGKLLVYLSHYLKLLKRNAIKTENFVILYLVMKIFF
jgi:hypothetical protein